MALVDIVCDCHIQSLSEVVFPQSRKFELKGLVNQNHAKRDHVACL